MTFPKKENLHQRQSYNGVHNIMMDILADTIQADDSARAISMFMPVAEVGFQKKRKVMSLHSSIAVSHHLKSSQLFFGKASRFFYLLLSRFFYIACTTSKETLNIFVTLIILYTIDIFSSLTTTVLLLLPTGRYFWNNLRPIIQPAFFPFFDK